MNSFVAHNAEILHAVSTSAHASIDVNDFKYGKIQYLKKFDWCLDKDESVDRLVKICELIRWPITRQNVSGDRN